MAHVAMCGDSLAKAKDIFRVHFLKAEDRGCGTRMNPHTVDPGGLPQRLSWKRRWSSMAFQSGESQL